MSSFLGGRKRGSYGVTLRSETSLAPTLRPGLSAWGPVASQDSPLSPGGRGAAQAQRPVTNFPSHLRYEIFSYLKHFLMNYLSTVDEVNISFDQ